MKKLLKFILALVVIVAVIYNVTLFYVNLNIKDRVAKKSVYNNCHKAWSARGIYSTKEEQNSIKSFTKAIEAGYIGFEVDFYYDKSLDKFIISHDKPKKDSNGKLHYTLKDGKLFTLEELFSKFGKEHYFWLDFKNLDRLNKDDTSRAISRLQEISKINNIKNRIYIEGCNPFILNRYEKEGFKTLLSFHPLPKSSPFTSISTNFFKMVYYFSDTSALAMQYGILEDPKYNELTQKNLKSIPQFIFHVPTDKKLINSLLPLSDVRVLLIGRDKSVNYAKFDSCKKE